jgi:tetratricopeptide (TPR) repeat protein
MSPRFPRTTLCLLMAFMAGALNAQVITTTDGQTYTNPSIRRSGAMIMIKVTMEGGTSAVEMGLPISRIAKVAFPEPPELAKAIAAASKGNAAEVLSLTGDYVQRNGDLKDVPGSWWPEMARLRLLALAASGKDTDCADLARQIGAVNNPISESLARAGALFAPLSTSDLAAVLVGAKALTKLGGDQGSALAQLALGKALLQKKDFAAALRSFLTIKVFYPSLGLLQAPALAGAAEAYQGLKDEKRAAQSYDDIVKNWPDSPQVPVAKKKAEILSHP